MKSSHQIRFSLRVIAVLLLGCAASGISQSIIPGKGPFQIEVDVAKFQADASLTFIEIYYSVQEIALTYREDSAKYRGGANLKLEIRSDSASVARKEWMVPHTLADTAITRRGQSLIGIQSLGLPKGEYRLSVTAHDIQNPSRKDSISVPLSIKGFPETAEALSDIELASIIRQSGNTESIFYKNTLEVIPNASRMYGVGLPILHYYIEVYNLAKSSSQDRVTLRSAVINASGREVLRNSRSKPRQHNSTVEVGSMNLSALTGGSYRLHVAIVDTTKTPESVLAFSEKKFFVYRPERPGDTTARGNAEVSAAGEFSFMTAEELDRSFRYAQYIANAQEQKQYEQLTEVSAKQNFLAEFWRQRDPDPSTYTNETKDEYYERVEFANQKYSMHEFKTSTTRYMDGWRTDRGRVYIMYGKYSDIEREPNSAEYLPYEVWVYEGLQGGVVFAFVDRKGTGDYTLVHSSHRNELSHENWMEDYARKVE